MSLDSLVFLKDLNTDSLLSEDQNFKQILQSIIDFVEAWKFDWIKLQEKWWNIYYRVFYIDNEGKKQRKEISLTRKIKDYIKKWFSQEEATFQVKLEVLKECFDLRFNNLIDGNKEKKQTSEEFCESLLQEDGSISGISLEIDHRYSSNPILFRIRKKVNSEERSTSLKINHEIININWDIEIRGFMDSLKSAISKLLEWYPEEYNNEEIKYLLLESSFWYYYNKYNEIYWDLKKNYKIEDKAA